MPSRARIPNTRVLHPYMHYQKIAQDMHVSHVSCMVSLLRLELESLHIHAILGQHSASESQLVLHQAAQQACDPQLLNSPHSLHGCMDIFSTLFSSDRKNSSQAQSKTLMVSPQLHSLQFSRVQQTTLQPNTFRSVSSLSLP